MLFSVVFRGVCALGFLCILCPVAAYGIEYSDFPPAVRVLLDERLDDIQTSGGVGVAGRVSFSDGVHVGGNEDVLSNFCWDQGTSRFLDVYDGGWFVLDKTLDLEYDDPPFFVKMRAFGYDPLDADVTPVDGQIVYVDLVLTRTPEEDLGSVTGYVFDENGDPMPNWELRLRFPLAAQSWDDLHFIAYTDSTGYYSFEDVMDCDYTLQSYGWYYTNSEITCTVPTGGVFEYDFHEHPKRKIRFEYVYQPDGSPDLTNGNLDTEYRSCESGGPGFDFSNGEFQYYPYDINLRQEGSELEFFSYLLSYEADSWLMNGFYDAGEVPLDSVTEADPDLIEFHSVPVAAGHTYVVRTFEEFHYAKLFVHSNRYTFRSFTPFDPDPLEFPELGVTVDFWMVSKRGRLEVDEFPTFADIPGAEALPHVYRMTVYTGVRYGADVTFTYSEEEMTERGLYEERLNVYRTYDGANWDKLPSTQDLENNTLTIGSQTSFGRYAIAGEPNCGPDFDDDGDVDLKDFKVFQACFTGEDIDVTDPYCNWARMDLDFDVDLDDYTNFEACFSGAGVPMNPDCLE